MPSLDEWIAQTLSGVNTAQVSAPSRDQYAQILQDRPDVLAEYNRLLPKIDWNSPWAAQNGFIKGGDAVDFATHWYNKYGKNEGYQLGGTQTPTPTPTPTPDPTPSTPAPTTPAPVSETDRLQDTINQLLSQFNNQFANTQALETQRQQARGQVQSQLGSGYSKISGDLLSTTVNDILSGEYDRAKTQLERGFKRGQFNDQGYNAALAALDKNKTTVGTTLNTKANDILSGYRKSYDDIRSEALQYANNLLSGDTFKLDDYLGRANSIVDQARDFAPGALLSSIGSSPLFNISNIRNAGGEAQGALNLKDMDVIDALSKRKQVAGVGRGLGSQGAF